MKGHICNRELVEYIFDEYDVQGVIHFAVESHVDNSIKDPGVFIETNVNGTFTLLDVAYKHWMEKPFKYKEKYTSLHPELDSESSYKSFITFVNDRAGHDRRYAIDATKLEHGLGWTREYKLEELVNDMMASDLKLMTKDQYLKDGGYKIMNYFE